MITVTSVVVTTIIVTAIVLALVALILWMSGLFKNIPLPVAEKHKHAWTIVRTTESSLRTNYLLFCPCGETKVEQLDGKEVRGRTIANSILEKLS